MVLGDVRAGALLVAVGEELLFVVVVLLLAISKAPISNTKPRAGTQNQTPPRASPRRSAMASSAEIAPPDHRTLWRAGRYRDAVAQACASISRGRTAPRMTGGSAIDGPRSPPR